MSVSPDNAELTCQFQADAGYALRREVPFRRNLLVRGSELTACCVAHGGARDARGRSTVEPDSRLRHRRLAPDFRRPLQTASSHVFRPGCSPAVTAVPQPGIVSMNQSRETLRLTVRLAQHTTKGAVMFQRRLISTIAAVFVTAVLAAGPAGAQAPLGFTIDPTQGFPGSVVTGQVDPADIAESCVTNLAEFQARFNDLALNVLAFSAPDPLYVEFFPPDVMDIITTIQTHDQLAYTLTLLVTLGIGINQGGAAEAALPQTFVMAFADLATQQPIGQLGSFDPVTGVGLVVVPDLPPGVQPVVAVCAGPNFDRDALEAGIRRSGAFLAGIGAPPISPLDPAFEAFAQSFLGSTATGFELLIEFATAVGPTPVQKLAQFYALGLQSCTVLQPLHHLQCYNLKNSGFDETPVTLTDRFGTRSMTVRKARQLCAPADKNGEDPSAPMSPDFMTAYSIKGGGKFERVRAQTVVNQFGTLTVDITTPRTLLVPSAYSPTSLPSSPDGAFVDHFTCYDVRVTNRTPKFPGATVTVQTALETATIQVQKPERLCVPTDKNGEDPTAPTFPENFLCYKTKAKGSPSGTAFLNNQFGPQIYGIGSRSELCVPTQLNPPPTTTTTSTTSTTTQSTPTSTESTTTSTESTTTATESTTTSTESTTTSTESTTTSTESTTTSTESTTTSTEPTTTTTTSTTTTTMGSPSGAFLEDATNPLD